MNKSHTPVFDMLSKLLKGFVESFIYMIVGNK